MDLETVLKSPLLPPGQYGWVHYWPNWAPTPKAVIQRARAAGCVGLLVKYNDGASVVAGDGSGQRWQEQFRRLALAAEVDWPGALVIPWGYVYPTTKPGALLSVVQQALADSRAVNPRGWYIVDAEIEFDRAAAAAAAAAGILEVLRTSGARLLYTSWGWPDQHPSFPWRQFQDHCEGFLPQVYPALIGVSPDLAWNRAYGGPQFGGPRRSGGPPGFAALKPERPVIPAFDLSAVERCAGLARNWGAPAVTWWSLDQADSTLVAALAGTPYARPAPAEGEAGAAAAEAALQRLEAALGEAAEALAELRVRVKRQNIP